jgi:hypothetical protein
MCALGLLDDGSKLRLREVRGIEESAMLGIKCGERVGEVTGAQWVFKTRRWISRTRRRRATSSKENYGKRGERNLLHPRPISRARRESSQPGRQGDGGRSAIKNVGTGCWNLDSDLALDLDLGRPSWKVLSQSCLPLSSWRGGEWGCFRAGPYRVPSTHPQTV